MYCTETVPVSGKSIADKILDNNNVWQKQDNGGACSIGMRIEHIIIEQERKSFIL